MDQLKGITIVDITRFNIDDIPDDFFKGINCKYCIYWESPRLFRRVPEEQAAAIKRRWFERVMAHFSPCGALAYYRHEVVAYAQFAPPHLVPSASYYRVKPDEDAVLITCLTVAPGFRRKGIGTAMLRYIEVVAATKGFAAVESLAMKGKEEGPSGPVEFYLKNGYYVKADDEQFPLVRKDL